MSTEMIWRFCLTVCLRMMLAWFGLFVPDTQFSGCFGAPGLCSQLATADAGVQPSAPAPAAAWGYTTLALSDDWSYPSTEVDLNNTRAPGFNWYVNDTFPALYANGSVYSTLTSATTAPPMAANQFTFNGGVMSMTVNGGWQAANTCVWNGSIIIGTTFGGGMYVDIQFSFDPSLKGAYAWPTFWFLPREYLDGSITSGNFVEIDGFEAEFGPSMYLHEWSVSNGTNNQNSSTANVAPYIAGALDTFDYAQMHHYGLLWVPMRLNGGTGLIQRYVDGVLIVTQTYSASGNPDPAMSANTIGELAEMDNENFCMMVQSGQNWPIYVGTVHVWHRPPTTTVDSSNIGLGRTPRIP